MPDAFASLFFAIADIRRVIIYLFSFSFFFATYVAAMLRFPSTPMSFRH